MKISNYYQCENGIKIVSLNNVAKFIATFSGKEIRVRPYPFTLCSPPKTVAGLPVLLTKKTPGNNKLLESKSPGLVPDQH